MNHTINFIFNAVVYLFSFVAKQIAYLQFDDVLQLRKCHIIKTLSLKFVQEIFEMRSSTSAVTAFPEGLSNDSGCHHKIQATDCFFFFLRAYQYTTVHNYSLFLLTLNAYPNRPCCFMPGYLAMYSFFCLESFFLECCPLEKSYPPNVDPFLLCHHMPGKCL